MPSQPNNSKADIHIVRPRSGPENLSAHPPGGFRIRLAAVIVDSLIMAILLRAIRVPFQPMLYASHASQGQILFFNLSSIIFIVLAYKIYPLALWGCTLGKRVFGLRVIRADGGADLVVPQVLMREVAGKFLSSLLFIGYLMALNNKERRALHDDIAKTRVVRVREGAYQ